MRHLIRYSVIRINSSLSTTTYYLVRTTLILTQNIQPFSWHYEHVWRCLGQSGRFTWDVFFCIGVTVNKTEKLSFRCYNFLKKLCNTFDCKYNSVFLFMFSPKFTCIILKKSHSFSGWTLFRKRLLGIHTKRINMSTLWVDFWVSKC
jgi:hypothetical protein